MHYKEQEIREELEAHIQDMIADLVHDGMNTADAEEQAREAFGEMEQAVQSTIAVEGPLSSWFTRPIVWVTSLYAVISIVLTIAVNVFVGSSVSAQLQVVLLWWIFVGITGLLLLLLHWILDFVGSDSLHSVRLSFLFTIVASISITSVLDIDNFEGNVHAVVLGIVVYGLLALLWKRVTVKLLRAVVFGFGALVTWTTLIEEPLFQFFGTSRCLFITPDGVELVGALAQCKQVGVVSRPTAPLIIAILLALFYVGRFLKQYVFSQNVHTVRKLVLSAAVIAMPVVPAMVPDLNNYGELDVVPYKRDIYESYISILGRSPEEKDYLFYGRTRAYENMDAVEDILFESRERRVKVNLLYLEIVGRSATPAEVTAYIQQRLSIEEIRNELLAEYGGVSEDVLEELETFDSPSEVEPVEL